MTAPSSAHEVRPAYLELTQKTAQHFDVMWKVPARNNNLRIGLNVKFCDGIEYITQPRGTFGGNSYVERWQVSHPQALIGCQILIDGLQSTLTDVLIRIERLDSSVQIIRLMPDKPSFVVDGYASSTEVAVSYLTMGMKHIWAGIDHLLFLMCLLLIAGSNKRILITITGFTAAHSLTLVLSSLQIVTLSIAADEVIIALSIVFLACEIAKGHRKTLTWNYPITVAASFGLLHGFGFAAVLDEVGLPQNDLITGLLFFNIGVEIGQLVFVVSVVCFTKLLMSCQVNIRQTTMAKPIAYIAGTLAVYWMIERSINLFI
jgi:hydrogenase/urease accessory protein HupE